MRRNGIKAFISNEAAAIAPMYAIALFGLVGIAGVGFDYGRLMSMDSELQNAADQAALAAATQLDGREGAMVRARNAANDYLASADSQWVNQTRMSNDGEGRAITADILTFRFYESYDGETDTFGTEITDDEDAEDANVVSVTVNGREVFYALTPIVGAISSGDIAANAVAGLQAASCNVPPLMFCAPSGDNNFPTDDDIGIGIDLHEAPQSTDFFAPGNFDFLAIDYEGIRNNEQNKTLGLNSDLAGCTGAVIETRPGNRTPEVRAVNTRFDLYGPGTPNCRSGGDFCPAQVVRHNSVRRVTFNGNNPNNSCSTLTGGDIIPVSEVPASLNVGNQGFPLDACQISGSCLSFGDGNWDANSYMMNVHGQPNAGVIPGLDLDGNGTITRYEVYKWELADASRRQPRELGRIVDGNRTTLYCSAPTPTNGTPVIPSTTQKDRRVVTVASVDCTDLSGRDAIKTIRWVDLFLLQPANITSSDKQILAEIVGPAQRPGGGQAFQYYGRNKAVLLR
ncbi:pilus assembly protein TadG-related protein [Erythrobacter sp. HKB08]|uniref:pilus assembly protein TadG-related protein n=1 Tax=Erythrobacter sp. HKB08 TaxID=2502843 RepID=UPI00100915F1|nr:pilus assembly protein TadG-related protein [Erythrobacter sp. HKB08]